MNMKELLVNAGCTVTCDEFDEWVQPSEVQFPFGSLVSEKDSPILGTCARQTLSGINFIRKNMKTITEDELRNKCPVTKSDAISKYIFSNVDRIRVMTKGGFSKDNNGYLKCTSPECRLQRDTPFGYADVITYFKYSSISNRFLFHFDQSSINLNYQRDLLSRVCLMHGESSLSTHSYEDSLTFFMSIRKIVDETPYILLHIDDWDGCCISHKRYKDKFGCINEAATNPCLGVNIKKHKGVMNRLKDWFQDGGYIKDDEFYLICENRDNRNKLYLSLWREVTLPNEYTWVN